MSLDLFFDQCLLGENRYPAGKHGTLVGLMNAGHPPTFSPKTSRGRRCCGKSVAFAIGGTNFDFLDLPVP